MGLILQDPAEGVRAGGGVARQRLESRGESVAGVRGAGVRAARELREDLSAPTRVNIEKNEYVFLFRKFLIFSTNFGSKCENFHFFEFFRNLTCVAKVRKKEKIG